MNRVRFPLTIVGAVTCLRGNKCCHRGPSQELRRRGLFRGFLLEPGVATAPGHGCRSVVVLPGWYLGYSQIPTNVSPPPPPARGREPVASGFLRVPVMEMTDASPPSDDR